jgi:hypothetical protein
VNTALRLTCAVSLACLACSPKDDPNAEPKHELATTHAPAATASATSASSTTTEASTSSSDTAAPAVTPTASASAHPTSSPTAAASPSVSTTTPPETPPGTAGGSPGSDSTAGSGPTAGTDPTVGDPTASGGDGDAAPPNAGACALTADRLRITTVDVGQAITANEDEAALMPIVISPKPSGGSRLAWMSDGMVHVGELDATDQLTANSATFAAHDFADLYADDAGGVLLLTRDAPGGGTGNCGEPTNLCGEPPDPAIPCFDMHLVRFDDGAETWATQLTDSSSALPSYSTSKTGPEVVFVWWYAHHGRIAFDGQRYASYFGAAISVSQDACINIHQGDRMKLVDVDGQLQNEGFGWGCSHSGYERIVFDPTEQRFVTVCKTDNNNRIAFAPDFRTIKPVDLAYSNFGDVVLADGGGYWLISSDRRDGEPEGQDGNADIHLLHALDGEADRDLILMNDGAQNQRAPHLARYGQNRMLAAWEESSTPGDLRPNDPERQLTLQVLDATTGATEGEPLVSGLKGNRYHALRTFPDGSVAYVAAGSSASTIDVLRVLPCE